MERLGGNAIHQGIGLPGALKVTQRGVQSLAKFKDTTKPIFEQSKRANPECRHYVILKREPNLRDIDKFNTQRLGVEDFFYKLDKTGVVRPNKAP